MQQHYLFCINCQNFEQFIMRKSTTFQKGFHKTRKLIGTLSVQHNQKKTISTSLMLDKHNMNKSMNLRDRAKNYDQIQSPNNSNNLKQKHTTLQMLQAREKLKQDYNLQFQKSLKILIRDISQLKDKVQLFTLRKESNQIKKFDYRRNTKNYSKKKSKSKLIKNCIQTIFQPFSPSKIHKKNIQISSNKNKLHKSCNLSSKKTQNNQKCLKLNQFSSLETYKDKINKSKNLQKNNNYLNFSGKNQYQETYFPKFIDFQNVRIQQLENYNKKLFLHNKFIQRQIKFQSKQNLKSLKSSSKPKDSSKKFKNQPYNPKQQSLNNLGSKINNKHDYLIKFPLNLQNKINYKQRNKSLPKYEEQITLKFSGLSSYDVQSNKMSKQHSKNQLDQSLLLDCLAIQCNEQMILKQKVQQNKSKINKTQQSSHKNKSNFICNKQNQYQTKKIQREYPFKSFLANSLQQNRKYASKTPQIKQMKNENSKDVMKLQEKLQSLTILLRQQEQKQKLTKIKMRQQISEIAHQLNIKKGSQIQKSKFQSPSNPRWLL